MKKILLLLISSVGMLLYAATPEKVVLLNIGKMYIAPPVAADSTSMYVVNAVRCDSVSDITLNGVLKVGGNFVQDAETNAFTTDASGYTTSQGKMIFADVQGVSRYITTNEAGFDRAAQYVAFPQVEIETSDTIIMPPKMGIDALSVKRSAQTGFILLKSDLTVNGTDSLVYDASLRVTSTGNTSENLVDLGSVITEQYVGAYRNGNQMFPFATPYKNTQLSGYYAGNWVRRILHDDMYHSIYVLGDTPSLVDPTTIDRAQYVIYPTEPFAAGSPYLIVPRPENYPYSDLKASGGLGITDADPSLYDQDKFTFNGTVYTLPQYQEQLFAEDVLFSYTFAATTTPANTLNWVIGNSYTSPLSVDLIKEEVNNSPIVFAPYIYVYTPGSTTYQTISLLNDGTGTMTSDEIPAKSIFMLRVSKNQGAIAAGTKFEIGKQHQIHGNLSQNYRQAPAVSTNRDINLRATLTENQNIFDVAAIGLRQTASLEADNYDIPKIYSASNSGFQLYTQTPANSKLASNGVPMGVDSVLLNFRPQAGDKRYTVTATQEGYEGNLWLRDLKTNTITDLQETPAYTFDGTETDAEERFVVYFNYPENAITSSPSIGSDESEVSVALWEDKLTVSGLTVADMDAKLYIYDVVGRILFSGAITEYPQQEFFVNLPKNIYVVSIQGERNFSFKIIK